VRIVAACILAFTLAAPLASCASPAPVTAIDDDKCKSYGFTPGTDPYAQCRMSLDVSRQQACSAAMNAKLDGPAVSPFQGAAGMMNTAAACRR
jgi:hypothetical protein